MTGAEAPTITHIPHSRACGPSVHPHGMQCHSNCPTCHGSGTWEAPMDAPTDVGDPDNLATASRAELVRRIIDLEGDKGELKMIMSTMTTRSDALTDAVELLERYDALDKDHRQGQGYTMLIEVQARALVAIAEALS